MSGSPKRLIEVAFPLKQTSLDSVHEKNVRHGHISTLHIWPARRPLAACRAALIATLLPDPGDDAERKEILERLAGRVVERPKKKRQADGRMVDELAEETEGGILHWGRESGPDLDWFRQKIRAAYGGRAPRVLDPFSGGGAIPLEAMRLGCEATAVDINPVAWFILKCTLEYPQKLAGQTRPLPEFALQDRELMESYFKAQGLKPQAVKTRLTEMGLLAADNELRLPGFDLQSQIENRQSQIEVDLAWHVRAWGRWVLAQARRDLARFYPAYADFEPLVEVAHAVERRPLTVVPLKDDGIPDPDSLNAEFGETYLANKSNPRWVAKPTVAYLWARTVTCKNCGTLIPLLKTRWLVKKDHKRVLLTMTPSPQEPLATPTFGIWVGGGSKNRSMSILGVTLGIQTGVPVGGHTSAERMAHDKKIGGGTISRSGAHCPICNQVTMTTEDIRLEGQSGRLGAVMTAVAVDGQNGKEYRMPTPYESEVVAQTFNELPKYQDSLAYLSLSASMFPESTRSISCHLYGIKTYTDFFIQRQLISLLRIVEIIRSLRAELERTGYSDIWAQAISAYMALSFDRLLAFNNVNVRWKLDAEAVVDAFARFSISILWDFAESQPVGASAGSWDLCYERIATALDTYQTFPESQPVSVINKSSTDFVPMTKLNLVITDPPYYQAISYADLSDFFYVWLRAVYPYEIPEFSASLTPKQKEIVQHIREDKDRSQEKTKYENGMYDVFNIVANSLEDDGRFVCVFAHKDPVAWETLVIAMIKAGFVVTASWPIQTEMASRQRASASAALSSSVWLVCRKRPESARPGWDNRVLEEMRANISLRLRQFWDAGIRGPDFVWAATGPALEAYSQYPAVKKANQPGPTGGLLSVGEFLTHVRRMVVDFVVGRVLSTLTHTPLTLQGDGGEAENVDVSSLDALTTYYLLHRNDFGLNDAPAGPCILYAVSCGLSDGDLADRYDLLARRGGKAAEEDESEPEDDEAESESEGTGSVFRLKAWNLRKRNTLGFEPGEDSSLARLPMFPELPATHETRADYVIPLIDQVHRLMHLWRAGDVTRVDDYLERRALRRNQLFHQLLQALIELSPAGSEERSLLESISNHVGAGGKQAVKLFN